MYAYDILFLILANWRYIISQWNTSRKVAEVEITMAVISSGKHQIRSILFRFRFTKTNVATQPTHRHWAKRWPNVIASIGERLQYNVGPKLK